MQLPTLKLQEIPFDHLDSRYMFRVGGETQFVATPAAIKMYQLEIILRCLRVLQLKAAEYEGLDYLQVFEAASKPESLWFIEDSDSRAVTALLPSDY